MSKQQYAEFAQLLLPNERWWDEEEKGLAFFSQDYETGEVTKLIFTAWEKP